MISRYECSSNPAMDYCHQHNLVEPDKANTEKNFGIRVTLPPGDPLTDLLGQDWERVHWYSTEIERDRAYDDMAMRHPYYRDSDAPSQILQKIVR